MLYALRYRNSLRLGFSSGEEQKTAALLDRLPIAVTYAADTHLGSLTEPIRLQAMDTDRPVKYIIDGVLYIFHNGKMYNAQGAMIK